jgi:subtilisin
MSTAAKTKKSSPREYVLLPDRGLVSESLRAVSATDSTFTRALSVRRGGASGGAGLTVLHSSREDGAKLVTLADDGISALRVSHPGVRAVPLVYYRTLRHAPLSVQTAATVSATAKALGITLKLVNAKTGKPVKGATVVAFTNFTQRVGAQGKTGAQGTVTLKFSGTSKQIELLLVYGPSGYWGLCQRNLKIKTGDTFKLQAVDLTVPDFAAQLYAALPTNAGSGVSVGVIDTGVDFNHPDLTVVGGAAFVQAEGDAGGYGPAKKEGEHGTHVAGIIASHGSAPQGKRGVAPAVTLHSYRVFPNAGGGASNYDILRAIDRGVADGCDLLNLSLGSPDPDDAVHEAIKNAFDKGTVCIAATGNDDRSPVSYPAAWPESVAVSAIGRKGSYPTGSTETLDEAAPFSTKDKAIYVAEFSNIGPQVDITGPGVGIVSTMPGGSYGVMSGTSMATPAAVGAAAAALAKHPAVLAMPRNRARATAIIGVINKTAVAQRLGKVFEGLGLLKP